MSAAGWTLVGGSKAAASDPASAWTPVSQGTHDFSSLTANPKGEGTYQIKTADGQTVAVPYSNVPVFTQGLQGSTFASPDEQARFAKDAAADPQRPSFWNALTNPVGSGAHPQGLVGGAEQVGGQAIKTMAQPLAHPIDTLEGLGRLAADAGLIGGPAALAQDVAEPATEQYLRDKQQGGNALALENVGGQVLGNVEGGRALGALASGVKPSAALGATGEAPAAGAAAIRPDAPLAAAAETPEGDAITLGPARSGSVMGGDADSILHDVNQGGKKVGVLEAGIQGKNADVRWLGDEGLGTTLSNRLGLRGLSQIRYAFAQQHPEVENLTGIRSGGAAGADLREVNVPVAGAAGEAAAAAAEGPANTVGGMNRLLPEAVRNGVLPSAWNWAKPGSPLGEMIGQPRGTVAPESASPLELKAYADANGIPFNAAQATQHNLPLNLQSAGERSTIGGTGVKQQIQAGQAAVNAHAESLMDQLSPGTPDVGTAGDTLQKDISSALDRQKELTQAGYASMDKAADGVTVDMKPLKGEAAKLLTDSSFIRENVPTFDPRRGSKILAEIATLPDNASFTQAGQVRSELLDEARHPDNIISPKAQGWIKNLSGIADSQMSDAAQSSPELTNLWRGTNARWKAVNEDFNSPRSPLYQALQEPDPNKVPQKFTTQGQIGGSPYNAELLDRYGIDKGPVKWALMGDMKQKNFGLYNGGQTLAGYSNPFLQSMFTPTELDSIYKTGAIARSLKANTNTSGTAAVTGAMQDVQKPIRSLLPKAGAAALTKADWFNNWLLKNPAPPSSDVAAYAGWLNQRHAALVAGALGAAGSRGDPGR